MFWRKSKVDREIDEMCKARNEKMDRLIEETKPEEEKMNDFIDSLIETHG